MKEVINIYRAIYLLVFVGFLAGCAKKEASFDIDNALDYCVAQASVTLKNIPEDSVFPRNVDNGNDRWRYVRKEDWTSGFWPGILWYLYEYTGDEKWQKQADRFSRFLTPLAYTPADNHDLGFMMYCSFGNGYRLTHTEEYKKIIVDAADTLANLYNPAVGTILSWPAMVKEMNWPHNTIVDNMMNLEMMFWAAKNGANPEIYKMAVKHAETTMKNHFRNDYSVYHVVVYDTITGKRIKGVTHQGYSDETMWARGQAWAIYGYTMTYRETRQPEFLDFARKVTDVYLTRLAEELIPYWDFDAPGIPNEPKDASAAAVTASALLELSTYVTDSSAIALYREKAERMIEELSSKRFQSGKTNSAFLLHSTGHKPKGGEIDASIIYADYYYLEALLRLKKLKDGKALL